MCHVTALDLDHFLIDRRYTLDYRHKLLRWESSTVEGARNSVRLQVRLSEGRPLVALPHRPGGRPLWFVADSGADTLVLFSSGGSGALSTVSLGSHAALETAGGRWLAARVLVPELRLGALCLWNVPAIQLPARRDKTVEGDGLLPLQLFAQFSFDPASEWVTVVLR